MVLARDAHKNLGHPWLLQMDACRHLPVFFCVFDITDSLKNIPAQFVKSSLDHSQMHTAQNALIFCRGLHVLDATSHLCKTFGGSTVDAFRDTFGQVLESAPLHLHKDLAQAVKSASSGASSLAILSSDQVKVDWQLQFIESKAIGGRHCLLALITDAGPFVQSRRRLHTIEGMIGHLPDFGGFFNVAGECEYLNQYARQIIGVVEDKPPVVTDFLTAIGLRSLVEATATAGKTREPWSGPIEFQHRGSRQPLVLQCRVSALQNEENGPSIGFSVTGKPDSPVEQMRAELEKRDKLIEEAGRLLTLGEISSQVIHEINNPMTVISGKAEKVALETQKQSPDVKVIADCAQKILKMTQRTEHIIRAVKVLSHKHSGLVADSVSLRKVIDEIRDLIEVGSRKFDVQVIIPEIPSDVHIRTDVVKLSQVFINLVSNAFEAISDLSERWVRFDIQVEGHWATVRIVDSGNGIAPHLTEQMFEKFFTTKAAGKGTGIGLNLSRQIVRSMGGDLTLDASAAHTTFVLRIPRDVKGSGSEKDEEWEEI